LQTCAEKAYAMRQIDATHTVVTACTQLASRGDRA
jgi:hypothetical protein